MSNASEVGIVVIGRNEGERLKRCILSLQTQHFGPIVYVDSGSTDGSVDYAQSVGVEVVSLDMAMPFTMARARNAGLIHLTDEYPHCGFVQFVDGDCEVAQGWISCAHQFLLAHSESVAVCGNRKERSPEASLYNHLIDLEWQGSAGEVEACGGDAMYRANALLMVDGFNEAMIAGEEAELCLRLRATGLTIVRLDQAMTMHDANMQKLSQWWLRSVRCGHAYAQGYDIQRHREESGGYKRRQLLSSLTYGVVLPALFMVLVCMSVSLALPEFWQVFLYTAMLFLISLYIRIVERAAGNRRALGNSAKEMFLYAYFTVLAKFPEAQGVLRYYRNKLFGKAAKIIEYRGS